MANEQLQTPERASGGRRSRRGRLRTMHGVVITVVALLVGALAGGAAGRSLDGPATELPELPAEFPDASHSFLPDVTVSAITDRIAAETDFECDGEPQVSERMIGQESATIYCRESSLGVDSASWLLEYDPQSEAVYQLKAECTEGTLTSDTYCPSVFSSAAALATTGQAEDLREDAKTWAEESYATDAVIVVGGFQLIASLDAGAELTIHPAS